MFESALDPYSSGAVVSVAVNKEDNFMGSMLGHNLLIRVTKFVLNRKPVAVKKDNNSNQKNKSEILRHCIDAVDSAVFDAASLNVMGSIDNKFIPHPQVSASGASDDNNNNNSNNTENDNKKKESGGNLLYPALFRWPSHNMSMHASSINASTKGLLMPNNEKSFQRITFKKHSAAASDLVASSSSSGAADASSSNSNSSSPFNFSGDLTLRGVTAPVSCSAFLTSAFIAGTGDGVTQQPTDHVVFQCLVESAKYGVPKNEFLGLKTEADVLVEIAMPVDKLI